MFVSLGVALASCTAAFMAVALGVGAEPGVALLMAAVLALSSTAVVTRELARSGELYARHGQLGVAVLLFQDLAAVLFLILIPALAKADGALPVTLAITVAKGLVLFAALIGIGKWVLPRVFFEVAKTHSEELFVLAALLVALLAALLTDAFGLSMTLGAFIAGMMLGESHFRHRIEIEIRPFRDVLLGIFFVSVGMLLVPAQILPRWPQVLGLAAALLVFKTVIVAALGRVLTAKTMDARNTVEAPEGSRLYPNGMPEDLRPGAQPQGVGAEHPCAVGVEASLGNGPHG